MCARPYSARNSQKILGERNQRNPVYRICMQECMHGCTDQATSVFPTLLFRRARPGHFDCFDHRAHLALSRTPSSSQPLRYVGGRLSSGGCVECLPRPDACLAELCCRLGKQVCRRVSGDRVRNGNWTPWFASTIPIRFMVHRGTLGSDYYNKFSNFEMLL